MPIDSERAPVPAACGPGTAHDALTTGKGSAAEKNWSSGSETYKIGANERVGVDHCQVLCPWWRCVDCHCLTQRPWPLPPHSAIFGSPGQVVVSLPFRKSLNIVLFVVDSRRHELKQHYESPAAVWCAIHLVFMPGNTENHSTTLQLVLRIL